MMRMELVMTLDTFRISGSDDGGLTYSGALTSNVLWQNVEAANLVNDCMAKRMFLVFLWALKDSFSHFPHTALLLKLPVS